MKCTELIAQDHMLLRRGLNILDRMVQIMEEGDRIEILDIRAVLRFLRDFGDSYHQKMEEKVLFPALLSAAPLEDAILQMLVEHGEERALVAAIEDALNPKHGIGFVLSSRRLLRLLREHLDKEDNVICAIAERLLSKEADAAIASEFMMHQVQLDSDAIFARLERKYATKRRTAPMELDRRAHA